MLHFRANKTYFGCMGYFERQLSKFYQIESTSDEAKWRFTAIAAFYPHCHFGLSSLTATSAIP